MSQSSRRSFVKRGLAQARVIEFRMSQRADDLAALLSEPR